MTDWICLENKLKASVHSFPTKFFNTNGEGEKRSEEVEAYRIVAFWNCEFTALISKYNLDVR